jgi:outer membrane lipoprotein carrier protein
MFPFRARAAGALVLAAAAILAAEATGHEPSARGPALQEIRSSSVAPPPAELAAAVQARYETVKDFSATFTQTYEGGVLRRKAREQGTVSVKKPGRMRWDYTSPEKKLFVSDGKTMFMYFPADRQVMRNPVPAEDEATSAVLFLMGKGNVTRDFSASYVDSPDENVYALRLEPRRRQAEYDWLELTVDRKTLQIRKLTAGDAQGGRSTFEFSNFKENTGLADKMFQFSIPRGTEVLTSGKTP